MLERIAVLALGFVLLTAPACGSDISSGTSPSKAEMQNSVPFPDSPSAHRFWNRSNTTLVLVDGAAKSFDAYTTHVALRSSRTIPSVCYLGASGQQTCTTPTTVRRHEANPLARPFVQTTAGQVVYSLGTLAADTGLAYYFHRTGHHKLEKTALMVGISYSTAGAAWNSQFVF